jgi:hypothetical protein
MPKITRRPSHFLFKEKVKLFVELLMAEKNECEFGNKGPAMQQQGERAMLN